MEGPESGSCNCAGVLCCAAYGQSLLLGENAPPRQNGNYIYFNKHHDYGMILHSKLKYSTHFNSLML